MVPRSEPVIPQQVKLAQQIILRLGDYSSMDEEENDIAGNVKALNEILLSVGKK